MKGTEEKAVKTDLSAETELGDTAHMQIKESTVPQVSICHNILLTLEYLITIQYYNNISNFLKKTFE